ncbi:carboxypeptidase-like regulatory domain-containing protein [Chryseobacterium scophthalmum]|uniref:carboxypeptidase-like regulatory domain-containing protein n=1 Tax=Chryseobacterium scophthalmum TaxID=59733 RepID=UPI003D03EF3D
MKELIYILFLLSSFLSFAQESKKDKKAIRGFVFDDPYFINTPLPLVEADITIIGTERKTTTDADGRFEIEAAEGEKLLISGLGIKTTEILIESNNCYKVILQSNIFDVFIPKKIARKNKRQERKIERKVKRKIKKGFYDCLD